MFQLADLRQIFSRRRSIFLVFFALFVGIMLFALLPGLATADGQGVDLPYRTGEKAMMIGENGYQVLPLFTVGEGLSGTTGLYNITTAGTYTPVGILDGIGATDVDADTVRLFVNHELNATDGYTYTVFDGMGGEVNFTGGRVSYYDINKTNFEIEDAGLAYDAIYDRAYQRITDTMQLDTPAGLDRLCSSGLFEADEFGSGMGIVDSIYFTGEESTPPFHPHGGTEWALDITSGALWAIPDMGRAAWENVTQLDTGTTTHVAFLVGDDTVGAPLYLYIGEKGEVGDGSFLDNNGLKEGQLYYWISATGEVDPRDFNTSGSLSGTWVPIAVRDDALAGMPGYDDAGYKDSDTLQGEAEAGGGFNFSRPEDVATNPADGSQAMLASTGRSGEFDDADVVGTLYIVDVDFTNLMSPTASLTIIYDGDADPNQELRSPDNLDWADNGWIYVQEDRAADGLWGDGAANPHESSILRVDPNGTINENVERVAEIDRSAVPDGQVDTDPDDVGNWESSGILDVSALFGYAPGRLFIFDVQAHSVEGGVITANNLAEGGQLSLLMANVPTDVFLSGIDNESTVSPIWLVAFLVAVIAVGVVLRRREHIA